MKDAYYTGKNSLQPTQSVGTGGLAVATAYGGSNELDNKLGFSNLVFSDLINSRDRNEPHHRAETPKCFGSSTNHQR